MAGVNHRRQHIGGGGQPGELLADAAVVVHRSDETENVGRHRAPHRMQKAARFVQERGDGVHPHLLGGTFVEDGGGRIAVRKAHVVELDFIEPGSAHFDGQIQGVGPGLFVGGIQKILAPFVERPVGGGVENGQVGGGAGGDRVLEGDDAGDLVQFGGVHCGRHRFQVEEGGDGPHRAGQLHLAVVVNAPAFVFDVHYEGVDHGGGGHVQHLRPPSGVAWDVGRNVQGADNAGLHDHLGDQRLAVPVQLGVVPTGAGGGQQPLGGPHHFEPAVAVGAGLLVVEGDGRPRQPVSGAVQHRSPQQHRPQFQLIGFFPELFYRQPAGEKAGGFHLHRNVPPLPFQPGLALIVGDLLPRTGYYFRPGDRIPKIVGDPHRHHRDGLRGGNRGFADHHHRLGGAGGGRRTEGQGAGQADRERETFPGAADPLPASTGGPLRDDGHWRHFRPEPPFWRAAEFPDFANFGIGDILP